MKYSVQNLHRLYLLAEQSYERKLDVWRERKDRFERAKEGGYSASQPSIREAMFRAQREMSAAKRRFERFEERYQAAIEQSTPK